MNEEDNKTYSAKVVIVSFALGVLLCLFGCVYFYSSRTESTESRNVNRTVQQLTTDEQRTEESVNTATERIEDAQDTTERLSESVDTSASILDRLQTELDNIAKANGLDDSY